MPLMLRQPTSSITTWAPVRRRCITDLGAVPVSRARWPSPSDDREHAADVLLVVHDEHAGTHEPEPPGRGCPGSVIAKTAPRSGASGPRSCRRDAARGVRRCETESHAVGLVVWSGSKTRRLSVSGMPVPRSRTRTLTPPEGLAANDSFHRLRDAGGIAARRALSTRFTSTRRAGRPVRPQRDARALAARGHRELSGSVQPEAVRARGPLSPHAPRDSGSSARELELGELTGCACRALPPR